jgi:hypothetical protein
MLGGSQVRIQVVSVVAKYPAELTMVCSLPLVSRSELPELFWVLGYPLGCSLSRFIEILVTISRHLLVVVVGAVYSLLAFLLSCEILELLSRQFKVAIDSFV